MLRSVFVGCFHAEQCFDVGTHLGYGQADDDLHGFALDHGTVRADGFEVGIGFDEINILDVDTQAGCTVGQVNDILGAAQAFDHPRSQFIPAA